MRYMYKFLVFALLTLKSFVSFADFGDGYYYLKGIAYLDNNIIKNDSFVISCWNFYQSVKTDKFGNYQAKIHFTYPCFSVAKNSSAEFEMKMARSVNCPRLYIYKFSSNFDTINFWDNFYQSKWLPKKSINDTQSLNIYFKSRIVSNIQTKASTDKNISELFKLNSIRSKEKYLYAIAKNINFEGLSYEQIKRMIGDSIYNDHNKFMCLHEDNCYLSIKQLENKIEKTLVINFILQNGYIKDWSIRKDWDEWIPGKNGGGMNLGKGETIKELQK